MIMTMTSYCNLVILCSRSHADMKHAENAVLELVKFY